MPRPVLPPTPASSTDVTGKDGRTKLDSLHTLSLPPPALAGEGKVTGPSLTNSAYQPVTPTSPAPNQSSGAAKRRRSSTATAATSQSQPQEVSKAFNLPPPPTRQRRIIQVKPRQKEKEKEAKSKASEVPPPVASKETSKSTESKGTVGSKKPSPNKAGSTGPGRRSARKTAHSIIERRRRSKMNEEFGTLKDMIPACQDQEMHKLAILQASIDYLRYLERCVSDMQGNSVPGSEGPDTSAPSREESNTPTPTLTALQTQLSSPAIPAGYDQSSYPSTATSALTSPVFSPFATSPALPPQSSPEIAARKENSSSGRQDRDLDHEATQALMMLTTDRRGSGGAVGAEGVKIRGGMSVRDLLAS
ncbi:MAG: hypothetical protein M4579_002630 [Chaenotheca gracillima]|nr:MAG: hypothetical protein M4579_002630 [Chaenotheca gracillima]